MRFPRWAIVAALGMASCSGSGNELLVELRTDLNPGRDFIGVRTERSGTPFESAEVRAGAAQRLATVGEPYFDGVRVAEWAGVESGLSYVRASLLGADGVVVAARTVVVDVRGRTAVTVLITSTCRGSVCPGPGDDPALSSCLGGRCVDPRCSPASPELCGGPTCSEDMHCTASVPCGRATCVEAVCLTELLDEECGTGFFCDSRLGCERGPMDAGMGDAGPVDGGGVDAGAVDATTCPSTETLCDDGRDDDCDGTTDCADSDCDSQPCDDGAWCNGSDRCMGGSCSQHEAAPCPSFCNEATMTCEACRADADCGPVGLGPWTICGGFGDTCDETGTQTRDVTTPRCVSSSCTSEMSVETGACSRTTAGTSCGTTSYGSWGSCGGYSSTCDETGTQSRSVTTYTCSSGTCGSTTGSGSQGCSRTTNGSSCASTSYGTWGTCGGYSSTCDETGTQSRSVTTYSCSSGTCGSSTGSQSQSCSRSTSGNSCVIIPGCPARCVAGACDPVCAAGCPC